MIAEVESTIVYIAHESRYSNHMKNILFDCDDFPLIVFIYLFYIYIYINQMLINNFYNKF